MGAEDLMSLLSLYGGEFYPETAQPVFQSLNDLSLFEIDTSAIYTHSIVLKARFNVSTAIDVYVLDTDELEFTLLSEYDFENISIQLIGILPDDVAGYEKVSFAYDRDEIEYTGCWMQLAVETVGDLEIAAFTLTNYSNPRIQPFISIEGNWYSRDSSEL